MTVPTAHFTKPALPPAALLAHLEAKGLVVADPVRAERALGRIEYYRCRDDVGAPSERVRRVCPDQELPVVSVDASLTCRARGHRIGAAGGCTQGTGRWHDGTVRPVARGETWGWRIVKLEGKSRWGCGKLLQGKLLAFTPINT